MVFRVLSRWFVNGNRAALLSRQILEKIDGSVKRFKSYLPHILSLKQLSADGCFSLSGGLCVLLFLITFYLCFIIKAF